MMLRSLVAGGQLDTVGAVSSRRLVTRERLREILRRVSGYGLPNALRMTVGTEEANRLVVKVLAEFLGKTV